jgi:hypothetical protein
VPPDGGERAEGLLLAQHRGGHLIDEMTASAGNRVAGRGIRSPVSQPRRRQYQAPMPAAARMANRQGFADARRWDSLCTRCWPTLSRRWRGITVILGALACGFESVCDATS